MLVHTCGKQAPSPERTCRGEVSDIIDHCCLGCLQVTKLKMLQQASLDASEAGLQPLEAGQYAAVAVHAKNPIVFPPNYAPQPIIGWLSRTASQAPSRHADDYQHSSSANDHHHHQHVNGGGNSGAGAMTVDSRGCSSSFGLRTVAVDGGIGVGGPTETNNNSMGMSVGDNKGLTSLKTPDNALSSADARGFSSRTGESTPMPLGSTTTITSTSPSNLGSSSNPNPNNNYNGVLAAVAGPAEVVVAVNQGCCCLPSFGGGSGNSNGGSGSSSKSGAAAAGPSSPMASAAATEQQGVLGCGGGGAGAMPQQQQQLQSGAKFAPNAYTNNNSGFNFTTAATRTSDATLTSGGVVVMNAAAAGQLESSSSRHNLVVHPSHYQQSAVATCSVMAASGANLTPPRAGPAFGGITPDTVVNSTVVMDCCCTFDPCTGWYRGRAGTSAYWCPEMLKRDASGERLAYGCESDWWSFGCLVYALMTGRSPFVSGLGTNYDNSLTLEGKIQWPKGIFSRDAKDFISKLLHPDPAKRLGSGPNGWRDVMSHPWFSRLDWALLEAGVIPAPCAPGYRMDTNLLTPPEKVPGQYQNQAHLQAQQAEREAMEAATLLTLTSEDEAVFAAVQYTSPDFLIRGLMKNAATGQLQYEAAAAPAPSSSPSSRKRSAHSNSNSNLANNKNKPLASMEEEAVAEDGSSSTTHSGGKGMGVVTNPLNAAPSASASASVSASASNSATTSSSAPPPPAASSAGGIELLPSSAPGQPQQQLAPLQKPQAALPLPNEANIYNSAIDEL